MRSDREVQRRRELLGSDQACFAEERWFASGCVERGWVWFGRLWFGGISCGFCFIFDLVWCDVGSVGLAWCT